MRVALFLLFSIAVLVPTARADEPVALKWSLKEGDTFYPATRIVQSNTVLAGGKTEEEALTFDFTLRYRVTGVKGDETTIEVTYLAADVRATGIPEVDGIGAKVRGASVTVRLDAAHALTGVRGHAEVLKRFKDATGFERATVETLFGENGVRELVGRPFDILPPKPLAVGGKATRDDRGTAAGLSSTGKTTFKVEGVDAGVAKVSVTSDMTVTTGGPAPAGAKVDLKAERAAGGYTFDTRTGRLKEFTHETVIGGSIEAEGKDTVKLTIRQKQTVVISDKNPVRD